MHNIYVKNNYDVEKLMSSVIPLPGLVRSARDMNTLREILPMFVWACQHRKQKKTNLAGSYLLNILPNTIIGSKNRAKPPSFYYN